MLIESRMVSSGSLATAGIVSVNSWYAAHVVFYHIPRKDHVMCGTEGALIKELSWSKLISNGMDGNRLRVFARPALRKNVPAVPFKLHHTLPLHRLPSRVDSLNEYGTTTYIGRQDLDPYVSRLLAVNILSDSVASQEPGPSTTIYKLLICISHVDIPTYHEDLPTPANYLTSLYWRWTQLWETLDAHIACSYKMVVSPGTGNSFG